MKINFIFCFLNGNEEAAIVSNKGKIGWFLAFNKKEQDVTSLK